MADDSPREEPDLSTMNPLVTPREALVTRLTQEGVDPHEMDFHVKSAIGRYVFTEEPERLRIQITMRDYVVLLVLSTLLMVGGAIIFFAADRMQEPGQVVWGRVVAGAVAVLGCWFVWFLLSRGRTVWILDRVLGQLLYRNNPLRPLSSITHIAIYAVFDESSKSPYFFVGFAPKKSSIFTSVGARGLRKDLLGFTKEEKADSAAAWLAGFLKVEVVPEVLE